MSMTTEMKESHHSPAPAPNMGARGGESSRWPLLSVIIPVRNDPSNLDLCLRALRASDYPNYEIIVLDDASTDRTSEVAIRPGVRLIRMDVRSGPAALRNRGARLAEGPYLLFIDADVCVRPDTLRQTVEMFLNDRTIDALFGSYDREPGAPGVLSQYRNLMHHYVHQTGNEDTASFWSGCGAIKRSIFLQLKGFDTGYSQASIEDIEFGVRLRRSGYRIVLAKHIQVKHMKRWSLASMIKCDVLQRGIPWTLVLLREGRIPDDLNLRYSQRLSVLLACCLPVMLLAGSWYYRSLLLIPLVVLFGALIIDYWTTRRPVPTWARRTAGLVIAGTVIAMGYYDLVAGHRLIQLWSLLALGLLLGIVLLNLRFYLFFARVKSPLFVPLVIPLHVLYYIYSGFSFAAGVLLYLWRERRPRARDEAT